MKSGEGFPHYENGDRGPHLAFTLTPQEEKDLLETHGTVLRDRRAQSAEPHTLVLMNGAQGTYEGFVEKTQRPQSGFDTDFDFVVSLTKWPEKGKE